MDFFQNKRVQRQSGKHKGKRLTQDQVRVLEKSFTSNKKLDPERKLQLAAELGVPSRQVAIWYQNRRARWKTQTLEVDYSALQVKLDSALAEKRVLEKDLEMIRAELRNAQEMLALANLSQARPSSNFAPRYSRDRAASGSCEEGDGSSNSSLNGDLDMNCCWEDENKTLQLDDLYACVMFANGSTRLD